MRPEAALSIPAPAGASGAFTLFAFAASPGPSRVTSGTPGPRALLFGPFPAPPLLGVWCPQPWASRRGPSCHCSHSSCPLFGELDKEIGKTFKQILSSAPPSLP